ncbi:MAG: hypothetical protein RLZZ241_2513 [Bacteroidota bacterium]|jgi:rRNA maturation RNase YbeY
MITYHYETDFKLLKSRLHSKWLEAVTAYHGFTIAELNYIFCDDEYLLQINRQYLNHDYLTDIITFPIDTTNGLQADLFISIDRVRENADVFNVPFDEELRRVLIHGVLHLMGHKDVTSNEKQNMRKKEDEALLMFHVKL